MEPVLGPVADVVEAGNACVVAKVKKMVFYILKFPHFGPIKIKSYSNKHE